MHSNGIPNELPTHHPLHAKLHSNASISKCMHSNRFGYRNNSQLETHHPFVRSFCVFSRSPSKLRLFDRTAISPRFGCGRSAGGSPAQRSICAHQRQPQSRVRRQSNSTSKSTRWERAQCQVPHMFMQVCLFVFGASTFSHDRPWFGVQSHRADVRSFRAMKTIILIASVESLCLSPSAEMSAAIKPKTNSWQITCTLSYTLEFSYTYYVHILCRVVLFTDWIGMTTTVWLCNAVLIWNALCVVRISRLLVTEATTTKCTSHTMKNEEGFLS